ncbi:hypothetical protein JTB14_029184 [Gonioctena quinquepunctata]|nr:hypothetical protein JTB14_029184 [Gonioctena quinquepunctata]
MNTSENEESEKRNDIDPEENWDNDNYSTYVPDLTRNILRQAPIGKRKRREEKKEFRAAERLRYCCLVEEKRK